MPRFPCLVGWLLSSVPGCQPLLFPDVPLTRRAGTGRRGSIGAWLGLDKACPPTGPQAPTRCDARRRHHGDDGTRLAQAKPHFRGRRGLGKNLSARTVPATGDGHLEILG